MNNKLNKKIIKSFFKQHAKKLFVNYHYKIISIESCTANGQTANVEVDEFNSGWRKNHQIYISDEDIIKWNLKNRIKKLKWD